MSDRALVTGASAGIGAAVAEELAARGAKVVITGRNEERLAAVGTRIGAAKTLVADLSEPGASAAVLHQARDELDGIDWVVASAGIFEAEEGTPEDDLQAFDRQVAVNLRAPYELALTAIPSMRPGSVILFVSSIAAARGFAEAPSYCATKAGIEAIARALAVRVAGSGVRVVALAPGFVATDIEPELLVEGARRTEVLDSTPQRRIAEPHEIATVASFLLSDSSSFITGSTITVDGGWSA